MGRLMTVSVAVSLVMSSFATQAAPPRVASDIFERVGAAYGLDATLLRSISLTESQLYPWTMNFGGASFYLPDRQAVVETFQNSRKRPWLVTVSYSDSRGDRRIFFERPGNARLYRTRIQRRPSVASAQIRRLDPDNVDIGLMQVNWGWHGSNFASIDEMSQVTRNIMYAAKMLREQIDTFGIFKGVGYYHSRSSPRWRNYYRKVHRSYARLQNGS